MADNLFCKLSDLSNEASVVSTIETHAVSGCLANEVVEFLLDAFSLDDPPERTVYGHRVVGLVLEASTPEVDEKVLQARLRRDLVVDYRQRKNDPGSTVVTALISRAGSQMRAKSPP